jgi:hypothetical protein
MDDGVKCADWVKFAERCRYFEGEEGERYK